MKTSLVIRRVDCDAEFEKELREVLRGLYPALKSLKVNGKTIDDMYEIVLYKEKKGLIKYVESDPELSKIKRNILEILILSPNTPSMSLGCSGYVFLSVVDTNFLDESVIAEEIIHSLITVEISEDVVIKEVFENFKIKSDILNQRQKLWWTAKEVVTHYHLFKILILQTDEKIREKLKVRLQKYVGEMIRDIRNSSFDPSAIAIYIPEIALVEELGFSPSLKRLDHEIYARIQENYDQILEILRDCNYLDIPKKGNELMLKIFKIQIECMETLKNSHLVDKSSKFK